MQNSQENTCARVPFFNKIAGLRPATVLKKGLWHMCFPVNFAKFVRIPTAKEHLWATASVYLMNKKFVPNKKNQNQIDKYQIDTINPLNGNGEYTCTRKLSEIW